MAEVIAAVVLAARSALVEHRLQHPVLVAESRSHAACAGLLAPQSPGTQRLVLSAVEEEGV